MSALDLGHGFIPRIDRSNYLALDRALGPQGLFDPAPVHLPWVILDGAWVIDNDELLVRLRTHGTRYLIDTSAWRFQDSSAQQVAKLQALEHAPPLPWLELPEAAFEEFVRRDLRLQAALGAAAYLVPGLIPWEKAADPSAYDKAAARALQDVAFERPLPAIATVGFHTQGVDICRERISRLSAMHSGIYLQPTPIDPYRASTSKLETIVNLLIETQRTGLQVIAGRMGAITVLLRSLGVAGADAGLAAGESFSLPAKLRAPRKSSGDDERKVPSQASRRYLPAIKRSVGTDVIDRLESISQTVHLARCDSCCRFLTPDDRVRRGREHSLITRVIEAQEVSALPPAMRVEHAEREWQAAHGRLAAANKTLREADADEIATDYLDHQLGVLRAAAARQQAA